MLSPMLHAYLAPPRRLPGYVRGAAAARRDHGGGRKDHRHTIYANMAKRSAIADAKEQRAARSARACNPTDTRLQPC